MMSHYMCYVLFVLLEGR